jgi:predicted transposase YbfD/YdcC
VQLVAIDGKTARHSFASEQDQGALHIVSAWASQHQVVLGQLATEAKNNEITAIPQLLEMLDLKGATVTIDAMGCQKKIGEKIVAGKADYILSLKENQPSLHREVQEFFASAESDGYRDVRSDYAPSDATTLPVLWQMRRWWAVEFVGIGVLRTACTGFWTWPSMKTVVEFAVAMAPITSPCSAR